MDAYALLRDPRVQQRRVPPTPVWLHLGGWLEPHFRSGIPQHWNRDVVSLYGVRIARWSPALLHSWLLTEGGGWIGEVTWTHPGDGQRLGGGLELHALVPALMLRPIDPRRPDRDPDGRHI